MPQASVAVAEPSAASIAAGLGLQPTLKLLLVAVIVGGVRSSLQVTVRDAVAVAPQESVAVNVLVCERTHPLLETAPSTLVIVGVPQLLKAVALPRAALIPAAVGLHPSASMPDVVIDMDCPKTFVGQIEVKTANINKTLKTFMNSLSDLKCWQGDAVDFMTKVFESGQRK